SWGSLLAAAVLMRFCNCVWASKARPSSGGKQPPGPQPARASACQTPIMANPRRAGQMTLDIACLHQRVQERSHHPHGLTVYPNRFPPRGKEKILQPIFFFLLLRLLLFLYKLLDVLGQVEAVRGQFDVMFDLIERDDDFLGECLLAHLVRNQQAIHLLVVTDRGFGWHLAKLGFLFGHYLDEQ